jgi:hypothetical protein
MDTMKFGEWLQIIASLGVIAGLILVAYELEQNRQHAIGESIIGANNATRSRYVTEVESDISQAYIKSYTSPDDLTDEEIFRLNAYLSFVIEQYGEWEALYEVGVLRYSGVESMDDDIRLFLTSRFGRAWYEVNRDWLSSDYPKIVQKLDQELKVRPVRQSPPVVEAIRSRLQDDSFAQ